MDLVKQYFQAPTTGELVNGAGAALFGTVVNSLLTSQTQLPSIRATNGSLVTCYAAFVLSKVVDPIFKSLEQQNGLWVAARYASSAALAALAARVTGFDRDKDGPDQPNTKGAFVTALAGLFAKDAGAWAMRQGRIMNI